jgi:uncharacterized RDD family membrane protein YckC
MQTTTTLATALHKITPQAGFVSRAAALILDILIVTAGSIVFAALVSLILNFFGFDGGTLTTSDPTTLLGLIQVIIVAVSGLAVFLFIPAYFVLFWVLVGATPGKQILGLKVIRTDGRTLGWGRAVILRLFSFCDCLFHGFSLGIYGQAAPGMA